MTAAIRIHVYNNDCLYNCYCFLALICMVPEAVMSRVSDGQSRFTILFENGVRRAASFFSNMEQAAKLNDAVTLIELIIGFTTLGFGLWLLLHPFSTPAFRAYLARVLPMWFWTSSTIGIGINQLFFTLFFRKRKRAPVFVFTLTCWTAFLIWILVIAHGPTLLHYLLGPLLLVGLRMITCMIEENHHECP